jgi:hypothetical protein
MIALLFSPLGRYLIIGGIVLAVIAGGYFKIRFDAQAEIKAEAQSDALRRMQDAILAGDTINISPDRLREHDSNSRD